MATQKISSVVDKQAWKCLKDLADESHQSISGVLSEAIREYVRRRRLRPEILQHLESSLEENAELGKLLAE